MAQPPKMQHHPTLNGVMQSRRMRSGGLVASVLLVLLFLVHRRTSLSTGDGIPTSLRIPSPRPGDIPEQVDWSRFAYIQYVTNNNYLCNSLMVFESLHRLGSRADRVMLYPSDMRGDENNKMNPLLLKARDEYNVKLVPIEVQSKHTADSTWAESFTKLLAFNQTAYSRVLHLDSDAVVLQAMDEFFLLPPCPVAMPRAYWLYPDVQILSSQLMLVQPSAAEFQRVMDRTNAAGDNDYDMEIVNQLYKDSAMVLPHRPYDLLTRVFWEEPSRKKYLGNDWEEWDPVAAFNEAKFLHFSDWPVPKPWIQTEGAERLRREQQPKCVKQKDGSENCAGRDIWNGIFDAYREKRERVCGSGKKLASR